jgi:hypothetical protein
MSDNVRKALALAESVLGPARKAAVLDEMNIFDPETWDFQGANDRLKRAFEKTDWRALATDMVKKGKLDLSAFLFMPAWIEKTQIGSKAEKDRWWAEACRRYQDELKSGKGRLFDENKKKPGFNWSYNRVCSLWKDVRAEEYPETREIKRSEDGKVSYREQEEAFVRMVQKLSAAVMRGAKDKKESVLPDGVTAESVLFSMAMGLCERLMAQDSDE